MLIKKKLILVFIFCIFNLLSFSQNIDSIFKSLDNNFNKSLESQNQMFNFYIDDFETWKDKVDLNSLSLEPEKAQKNNYTKSISNRDKIILEVNKYIGVPYIWGGSDPDGFDCSGLVQWTIKKTHDIIIPRTTRLQSSKWKNQINLNLNQIKIGDLIYFKTTDNNQISHVGIYTGNNEFIHAPNRSEKVKKSKINSFWTKKFAGFVNLDLILM
jgi:cell wall-associated NlpC family hydrolase